MGTSVTFIGMVIVILAQASNLVVSKFAFSKGMNKYVFVVYSGALTAIILLPFSLIFNRSRRPPVTFSILLRIFVLSLCLVFIRIFASVGLDYSSPVLATSMLNLVPAFTFTLAIVFRMERVDWRSRSSQAKLLGTIVSITGAFVATFYKGRPLFKTSRITGSPLQQLLSPVVNWILGGFFLATEAFMISGGYILQTSVVRRFPSVFTIMFYTYFFSTILSGIYSLFVVDDGQAWRLRLDAGLIAVLYSAFIACALEDSITLWCLSKAGPLYVSMFKPLGIIFAVVLGFLFLGESHGLGSLIGATVIVIGFYAVMWGKAKEEYSSDDTNLDLPSSASSDKKAPLLQTKIDEI